MTFEHLGQVAMAVSEPFHDVVERGRHVGVTQSEDVGDDARRPSFVFAGEGMARHEQLTDDACGVGAHPDRAAGDEAVRAERRGHLLGAIALACCSVVISASVDSVPWLRFTPSTSRPS